MKTRVYFKVKKDALDSHPVFNSLDQYNGYEDEDGIVECQRDHDDKWEVFNPEEIEIIEE